MVGQIFQKKHSLLIIFLALSSLCWLQNSEAAWNTRKKITIMCYMNGDNNLAGEVLHAVDMMETVGSSAEVDIIALVDGMPGDNGGYGPEWENTKLLHITKDDEVGVIRSQVIEDLGEENLGDPQVLEKFIQKSLRYPSEKYIFILFAHGRGIINTQSLDYEQSKDYKSVLLSPDETGQRAMSHLEFQSAIRNGLAGEKFHLMVFFSCLTNMVEVGYGLRDVTRYMIGSEDEIRIVNTPPGMFQIRGIEPEELIGKLTINHDAPAFELGKVTIDSFISQYMADSGLNNTDSKRLAAKYQATLALVDCSKYNKLSQSLDMLADHLIDEIGGLSPDQEVVKNIHTALTLSQKYPSFLNLEYLDLLDVLKNIYNHSDNSLTRKLCQNSIDILQNELIVYERHTNESRSNGVSIFFPSFLVPENIYRAHRSMYQESHFSRDTSWAALIDLYRAQMLARYSEFLIDEYELAISASDMAAAKGLESRISWALRKDIINGNYSSIERYLAILSTSETTIMPRQSLLHLQNALKQSGELGHGHDSFLKTVEALLIAPKRDIPGAS